MTFSSLWKEEHVMVKISKQTDLPCVLKM